jgi:FKBP-type peptidyl-prolyl cis-trans isomerase FkpA
MKFNVILKSNFLYFFFCLIFFLSCGNREGNHIPPSSDGNNDKKETMMEINKYLVKKESEIIESYVKRLGWDMNETESGLWYEIYHEGSGKKAHSGLEATITYTVELLDGTLCYEITNENPKTFLIGQGGVESGLEEGILLLQEGDKARFIMPPHLAHGLIGDDNKIPARATIIYDLTLISLSEK